MVYTDERVKEAWAAIKGLRDEGELDRWREAHQKNIEFIDSHWDELLKKYPEQWVAVKDQKVIAHNKDLMKLASKLHKMGETSNYVKIEGISKWRWQRALRD
ncbi:MAG: hypothetical protein FJ320_05595 [SAR202 cluster bacterium]|nr:hypothetical protein [SAR202 cluster bacterium]